MPDGLMGLAGLHTLVMVHDVDTGRVSLDCRCGWGEGLSGVPDTSTGWLVALVWLDDAWDRHAVRAGLDPLDPGLEWGAFVMGTLPAVKRVERVECVS
jgi:hypothetical protein